MAPLEAGTGKTTSLLDMVESHLAAGVKPQDIAFISFSKKAVQEAKDRAMKRFGLAEESLPYFKTIHALVFRQLNLRRDSVVQWNHHREIGAALGLQFQGRSMAEDGSQYGMSLGDRVMFLEGLSRVKGQTLRATWEEANEPDIDWWELERFARTLERYKQNKALLDYTDMLDRFIAGPDSIVPKLAVLVIDEAQDLSSKQWAIVRKLASRAERIYISGDDDQALHNWCGADVKQFLNFPGETKVLDQSHRVPRSVHKTALTISGLIRNRQEKTWKAKAEEGSESWYASAEEVDLSKGSWLLLARNGYMLAELEEMCVRQGLSYTSVGKSPLDSPSLKSILTWEKLRKGQSVPRPEIVEMSKLIGPRRWAPASKRALSNDSGPHPLDLLTLHAKFSLSGGPGDNPAVWPIWHEMLDRIPEREREYFIAARRRGETLTKTPRINISTIHAAKGGEAENVLLLTDVSAKSYEQLQKNPDDEHRVMYVAVTRTINNLHLVQPRTMNYYPL